MKFLTNQRPARSRSLGVILGVLGALAVTPLSFAATTWTQTWNISTLIPDNDAGGFSDSRAVSTPEITEIQSVTVNLNFTDGWNGDLYAYVVHDSGFAVLLNRAGRTLSATDGSATIGMNITFDDAAPTDLHTTIPLVGGSVTGTYQPSGRNIDPLIVLDTDPRTAMLSSFVGIDPSGLWTLFVADQSAGEESVLASWTIEITGIPEPSVALLGALGALLLLRRRR
jgi:subtilisin-like proprotein convertase family protein